MLSLLCLSTSARFGEAASLTAEQVRKGRVTFVKTKNGKQRTIPISDKLEKAIMTKNSGKLNCSPSITNGFPDG